MTGAWPMATDTQATRKRNAQIDTLRAVVLAGVIIVNMLTISGLAYLTPDMRVDMLGALDLAMWRGIEVLLDGKALAAFSFMFGLSFGLILHANRGADHVPRLLFLRRLLVLCAFGAFNALFLFWADILMTYAVLGLILPLAARLPQRVLIGAGGGMIVAGPVVVAVGRFDPPVPVPQGHIDNLEAYASSQYADTVSQNLQMVLSAGDGIDSLMLLRVFMLSGLFLLGLAAERLVRRGVLVAHRRMLLRWGALLIALGFGVQMLPADAAGTAALRTLNAPLMALGYLLVLARLLQGARSTWLLRALAPLGRMSLTGYLLSAALGQAVFYGWGLQLIGSMGTVQVLLVALAIYGVLAGFAQIWFRHFVYGPWEWVWRSLTRFEMQPLQVAR